jgi:hypothetical protein
MKAAEPSKSEQSTALQDILRLAIDTGSEVSILEEATLYVTDFCSTINCSRQSDGPLNAKLELAQGQIDSYNQI